MTSNRLFVRSMLIVLVAAVVAVVDSSSSGGGGGGVHANEVIGCGGFIKSNTEINYKIIKVKLLTRDGAVKYTTEASPVNGYYMIPIYNKGDYMLQVNPPLGWSFGNYIIIYLSNVLNSSKLIIVCFFFYQSRVRWISMSMAKTTRVVKTRILTSFSRDSVCLEK